MFVIEAANERSAYYIVETDQGYRWVSGDEGRLWAKRFPTQAAAGLVMLKNNGTRGISARVVSAPTARRRSRSRARTGFILRTDGHVAYYLIEEEGVYRWRHGRPAYERAVRFATREAAQAVIDSGYKGAGAGEAKIVATQD